MGVGVAGDARDHAAGDAQYVTYGDLSDDERPYAIGDEGGRQLGGRLGHGVSCGMLWRRQTAEEGSEVGGQAFCRQSLCHGARLRER